MNTIDRDSIRGTSVFIRMQATEQSAHDTNPFREARVKDTRQVIRGSAPELTIP